MKKPLRRILAALTLATATITGYALEDGVTAPSGDTAWGAPDTLTVPVDTPAVTDGIGTIVTPLDTAWG
jgi:hypothetical protein